MRTTVRRFLAVFIGVNLTFGICAAQDNEVAPKDNNDHEDRSEQTTPAYPRNVYKTDDVGLIIGGASEDAKAKVGRLRVQD
ncbi:MAG: hypothetical protein ACI9BW_004608 [Gammaproteobacteria bacterium]|jgi:hypothetical protein